MRRRNEFAKEKLRSESKEKHYSEAKEKPVIDTKNLKPLTLKIDQENEHEKVKLYFILVFEKHYLKKMFDYQV